MKSEDISRHGTFRFFFFYYNYQNLPEISSAGILIDLRGEKYKCLEKFQHTYVCLGKLLSALIAFKYDKEGNGRERLSSMENEIYYGPAVFREVPPWSLVSREAISPLMPCNSHGAYSSPPISFFVLQSGC